MAVELALGVMGRSRKESERRLPIDPRRIDEIDADLRERIYLENGYGERFGIDDGALGPLVGGLRTHAELVEACDILLLPKPMHADLEEMRTGQVHWGWPHCVQDAELTQIAIDGGLTLIAWEAMNHWETDGAFGLHVFHNNNELAGYSSVIHALQLVGLTGEYGRTLQAAVIGFGATGRGAVTALDAMDIRDISVLTRRDAASVAAPIHSARFVTYHRDPRDPSRALEIDSEHESLPEFLAEHDVIVNCVLQDTDSPIIFAGHDDLALFRPGTLFVDVSADAGMGFEWARPTSFEAPIFELAPAVRCYAVDHSPSLLWDSATWDIHEALVPYLRSVMEGPEAWEANETIRRAIEIRDGVVQNEKILRFQGRAREYPHPREG